MAVDSVRHGFLCNYSNIMVLTNATSYDKIDKRYVCSMCNAFSGCGSRIVETFADVHARIQNILSDGVQL